MYIVSTHLSVQLLPAGPLLGLLLEAAVNQVQQVDACRTWLQPAGGTAAASKASNEEVMAAGA